MAKLEKLKNIRQWFEVIFYTKPCRPDHKTKDLEEKNIIVNMVLTVSFFEGLGVVFEWKHNRVISHFKFHFSLDNKRLVGEKVCAVFFGMFKLGKKS